MKKWILISYLIFSISNAHAQRPDLTIGATASFKYLQSSNASNNYLTPGASVYFHLSKRSLLIGTETGYWNAISDSAHFHHIPLDISFGFMLVRKPAFKLVFHLPISNAFSLSSRQTLDEQTVFKRYSLLLNPELYMRYKYLFFGVNYSQALVGSKVRGPGLRIGCAF